MRNHRAFHEAMLNVLKDGKVHPREEVFMAGVEAVSEVDAIGSYQRRNPEKDDYLSTLRGMDKIREAQRQRGEGARLLAGKALSHLEDRKLMDPVDRDSKGKRLSYRITERGLEYLANPPKSEYVAADPHIKQAERKPCAFCDELLYPNSTGTKNISLAWWKPETTGAVASTRPTITSPIMGYAHSKCITDADDEEKDRVAMDLLRKFMNEKSIESVLEGRSG